jgi:membrane protease subunit (stomatin/prohibitin family)
MGIISFVKGGIRELAIARPDAHKGLVVYKHPDPTVPRGAQLTVEADEIALFFRDGRLVGQLPPGRHRLESENVPFFDQIVDWGTAGNLWIAEVYFVTTRELVGARFGGKIGKLRDPQSGLAVELMVNGTFAFRVVDAPRLVIGLVGLQKTSNEEFVFWFREQVLKVIKDEVAELCVKKKWPLLDVTSGAYSEEISQSVVAALRPHVEPYGIQVTSLGNFNLNMKPDDEERLNKLYETSAYVNMAGGIGGYRELAAGKAMMGAGEGLAQGGRGGDSGLGLGAGLGVGMAIANQMLGPRGVAAAPGGPAQVTCAKCGHGVVAGKFCAECGAPLAPAPLAAAEPKFCSSCGTPWAPAAKFCTGCGQKLA